MEKYTAEDYKNLIQAQREAEQKYLPSAQEKYNIFPNKDIEHNRIYEPTAQQEMDAKAIFIRDPRQTESNKDMILLDFGWDIKDYPPFKSKVEYYQKIIPVVTLQKIDDVDATNVYTKLDYNGKEVDRMVKDFFEATFY